MNMMNSLIIEGVVVGEPHYLEATQKLEFAIDSSRVHKEVAHSYGWSERRCYDLYKIWITIVSIFGDCTIDKALSIMGNFAFPN